MQKFLPGGFFLWGVFGLGPKIQPKYWKISIHAIGLAGPLTALWIMGYHFPIIMMCLTVLVSISRIILNAHTIVQVTTGLIIGVVSTYMQFQLLFL